MASKKSIFSASTLKKRQININLPNSFKPYEAIRTWQRDNNLTDYEGEYETETQTVNVPLMLEEPIPRKLIYVFVKITL